MSMRSDRQNNRGFTLIELLVVIGIMMLVASIIFGLSGTAWRGAVEHRAQAEVNALESAFRAYYNTYHVWPTGLGGTAPGGTEVNAQVVNMLTGNEVNGMNRRRITFMEFPERSLNPAGTFVDPWQRPYRFVFDHNFDNTVRVNPGTGEITMQRRVAVWSQGPLGEEEGSPIVSW